MLRIDRPSRQGATAAILALLALGVPRLITAAPLDLLGDSGPEADPAEDAEENFPGSAFFFAQGMFDRLPASASDSDHVLALDRVQAASSAAFRGLTPLDSYRALNCLTSAVYYEAGNEPEEGQRAVAQVVLNRVRNPLWPRSICAVVYQGSERTDLRCQFTFSCDGSMARRADMAGWTQARRVAQQALAGQVYAPVGLATFYHTLAVRPGWAAAMRPVAVIGVHIFYRSPGVHGSAAGFRMAYLGREFQSGPAQRLSPISPAPAQPGYPSSPSPDAQPVAIMPPAPIFSQPELPQSTIRPEYRNSGRPRI